MLAALERLQTRVDASRPVCRAGSVRLGFRLFALGGPGVPEAGWGGRNAWSSAKDATASSKAICCCRSARPCSPGVSRGVRRCGACREIGDRFAEADLVAFARLLQGSALGSAHRARACVAGRAMLAVTSGELSPVVTGILCCSAIGVLASLCARSRPRVDRRIDQLVRRSSAARHVHRPLPRPPGGSPADARRLDGGDRGGASRRGTLRTLHRS
jgi:hypothetical protein